MEKQYFISSDPSLFCFLFTPSLKSEPKGAVLIIPPFAEEKKSSQRILVNLGRDLCAKGFFVLLFDLQGTGDSFYLNKYNFSISDWLKNISKATVFLQEKSSIDEIVLIGLRFGAYLSMLYCIDQKFISQLILLEPIFYPFKYLNNLMRDIKIRRNLFNNSIGNSKDKFTDDDLIDLDGYLISNDFYNDLRYFENKFDIATLINRIIRTIYVNITPNSYYSSTALKIQSEVDCVEFRHICMPQFWNKIEVSDISNLKNIINDFLGNESKTF